MASILKAALQVWSSGKKKSDERKDASSDDDDDDNYTDPMTQQQQQQDINDEVDSPQVGKDHREKEEEVEEEEEEEEDSAGWSQLETQHESDLILKLPPGTIDAAAAPEAQHAPTNRPSPPPKPAEPTLSPTDETTSTPLIQNNARICSVVVADDTSLLAALAVPPLEMNLNRLRSMSRVFTALPPTLPSYRHMVLDQLEFLTHLLLLETNPTRLLQIQQDYLAALTHFCSLPQGREMWKAPGRLRSRSMLAAFALDLGLAVQETNQATGSGVQEGIASPGTLTAADWDALQETLHQLRTILLQRNANRAPGASATAAVMTDPDPQLVQHAMMTVDFDHVVHLLDVQRALACFRANLCRIAAHGKSFRKNNKAVERTVNEYVETLKRLFPSTTTTTTTGDNKKNDDDDDDSDMFANDEDEDDDDAIDTSNNMANVPKELHSFVLTDLYHPKQPADPLEPQNEGMVDRLLEHVQSLMEDTATPTGTTPGPYSYAHLLATARSLWIKWSESILEIPALVQLGYAGVMSPIVNLRDHDDDVSSWGGDGAVGEDSVEHAPHHHHHHHHHPSRQRSRPSSSKQHPPHSASLPRNQSETEDETMELPETPASVKAPVIAGLKPPPRKEVATQTPGIGVEEVATASVENLPAKDAPAPPMPNEPPARAAAPKQDPRPRGDSRQRDAAPPAVDIATQRATKQPQLASRKSSTKMAVNVTADDYLYSSSDDEHGPLLRSQRDLSTVLPQLYLSRKRDREPDLTDTDSVDIVRKASTPKRSRHRSSENSINQDSGSRKTTPSTNASETPKKKKKEPTGVLWSSDSDDNDQPIQVKVARTKPPQKRRAFTDEETAAIVKGVSVFGAGRWAEIRQNDACLQHRTNMQIKDKYRTIMKLA